MSDEKDSASERVEIPILEEYERPSLFSRIGSKHKSSQSTITTVTIDLEVKEIIIIKIDKHRELHLLNREDEKLYERIRDWMNDHPVATLQDTVDKFSSEPTGDAIAKVLHNFPFPDFILKFNIDEREKLTKKKPSKKLKRKNFERLLLKSGLIVEIEQDAARDNEFFVKLYAPFHQLCEQAQQIKLKMRLNAKIAEDIDIVLPKPKFHSIITKYFTHIVDFKKQAAFFRISKLRQFQGAEPDKSEGEIILNFFSMARRNLLVHRMIVTANQMNKRVDLGGIPIIVKRNIDSLSLKKLSKEKVFTKHYPLHDGPDNAEKGTPLSYMNTRAYLNEKWVKDDVNSVSILWDNALTAPYAFFMAVWATLFLETWKRNMAKIQYDWDILDFKKDELPRPEFYGTTLRRSPITLKQEIHFPFSQRFRKFFISGFVVFFTLGIVVVTIGVLLIFPKIYIEKKIGNLSSFVTSFVNLVTILILSMIYQNVARWLTNFENHKTYSLYEDSLIIKTYLFDFFNNYSALFYIMIFKQYIYEIIPLEELKVTSCEYGSCMSDLTIQLAIILIGKQFFGQFKEVLYPRYAKSGRTNKEIPQWAQDERLAHVDNAIRSEYEEMVVQFGFISLFGPAFPLAALFAWINNTSEIRFDAFKYVSTLQRPVGYQVQDIGMWENIMGIISQLAVLTNAIIIAFHSNWMKSTFQKFTGDNEDLLLIARLTFILVFEHLVFIIKLIFAYLISDIPKSIRVATEREHYIVKLTLEDEAPALDEYLAASNDTSLFDENWELKLPKKRNMISNIFDKTKTGTNNFKDIGDDGGSLIE
ncbi:9494_t:CDS:10 [Diversispora eburnea]|uniref:9494_t:CDS:1 n=1 Tax=Diversispora eburnea TaxID=1213867 RepID=A0A9N8V673_9GLOM|nr:9494_t:CDS:10 [Diversispora eburnea]